VPREVRGLNQASQEIRIWGTRVCCMTTAKVI